MHVTKWGEYGILCSVFLARRYLASRIENSGLRINSEQANSENALKNSGPVGAVEIAQEQGIPAQYTQQILQRLRRGGIVKSVRGAHGGYVLSRPPSEITLLDVMKAAEGSTFDVMCETAPAYPSAAQPSECSGAGTIGGCNLKGVWIEVRNAVDKVLSNRTLESLTESGSSGYQSGGCQSGASKDAGQESGKLVQISSGTHTV